MSNTCCPTCGRAYPKAKAAKPATPAIDTASLTLDELRAFYKRIGTREDCRFWLHHATYIPADIRAQGEALIAELETRDGRPADAKRLQDLKRAAQPYYRQVCGHSHHTSQRTAVACKLGMKPDVGTYGHSADQNLVIDEVLGWTPATPAAEPIEVQP